MHSIATGSSGFQLFPFLFLRADSLGSIANRSILSYLWIAAIPRLSIDQKATVKGQVGATTRPTDAQ